MENEEMIQEDQSQLNSKCDEHKKKNIKKKQLIGLDNVVFTRKLYIEGTNLEKFEQILKKLTSTQILEAIYQNIDNSDQESDHFLKDDSQQKIRRGVIRFKHTVTSAIIRKALKASKQNLKIWVSKSTSKNDEHFFLQTQSPQPPKLHGNINNEMIQNRIPFKNKEQQTDIKFNNLSQLIIKNPKWGFTGLLNYINNQIPVEEQPELITQLCEKLPILENAVRLSSILQQEQQQQLNKKQSKKDQYQNNCYQQQQQQWQQQQLEQQQQLQQLQKQQQKQQEQEQGQEYQISQQNLQQEQQITQQQEQQKEIEYQMEQKEQQQFIFINGPEEQQEKGQSQQLEKGEFCQLKIKSEEEKNKDDGQEELSTQLSKEQKKVNEINEEEPTSPLSSLLKQYLELVKLKEEVSQQRSQRQDTLSQIYGLINNH